MRCSGDLSRNELMIRNFTVGVLFAASVTTVAIGFIHFFEFYYFPGLNTTAAIAMMATGGTAALAISAFACWACAKRTPQHTPPQS
ncbi:MAG: hypothetical protein H7A36_06445 [Chlamydiales bacterium]|nr:hypothetical protein [Chlamydiales bacterium]